MTDNEKELMIALEKLNLKYLKLKSSKEQQIGKKIINFIQDIKDRNIKNVISLVKKKMGQKKIDKMYPNQSIEENLSESDWLKHITHVDLSGKVAVYTCITGKYDNVIDPIYINQNFDFYIFTDQDIKSKIWIKREIPKNILGLKDNILINRYIKMHPFELFPDYDYAVYIDGNACIVSDISSLINKTLSITGFAMHRHVLRNDIYEEAMVCALYGKGNREKLKDQISLYRNNGFPKKFGMLEANVIIFDLNSIVAKTLMLEWWEEFLRSGSMRDQIALPYILWKNNYTIDNVGFLGKNVYRNSKFQVFSH